MVDLEQRQRTARAAMSGIGAVVIFGWIVTAFCVGVSSTWWEGALQANSPTPAPVSGGNTGEKNDG